MKIETTTREDHQAQITAEIDSETFEKYMHKAARKISRDSKIPGFRPGKAPYDVVRRLYGDDALRQQAVELMLDDVYPQVLEESAVKPSGPGKLDKIVSFEPPVFSFLVPLEPVVQLGDYHAIHQDYDPKTISDSEVEDVLTNLQRRSATAEPVERPAAEDDLVYLKLSADYAEPQEGEDPVFIKETPYQVVVGEDKDTENAWPFPNFSHQLLDLSANDEKVIPYTYPEDSEYEKLRGRTVNFNVVVQSVKSLELPELNDDFAQSMGEFENVEQLRVQVRKQLEDGNQNEYDDKYLTAVIDEIIAGATIKFPPDMLDEEVEHLLEHLQEDLSKQHLDLETYLKTRQLERAEFIEQEVKPAATKRLQRSLVMNELGKVENVQLAPGQLERVVQQRFMEMASSDYFKKKPTQAELRDLANALSYDTASRLMNDRIMARLKSIASGLPEPVDEPVAELSPVDEYEVDEEVSEDKEVIDVVEVAETEESAPEAPTSEESAPADKETGEES